VVTPRIGLIGCGRWGRLILRDLLASGAQVHVAVPSEATRARALAEGATIAVPDLAQLGLLDGYVVATPTATHAAVLERLLPRERPLFVEKPMTADLASAERLARAAAGRLFVMDKWRYHPCIEAMRREIAAGTTGEILAIRGSRWQWAHPHLDVDALWILASHELSIVLHLTGGIPPLRDAWPAFAGAPSLGGMARLGGAGDPEIMIEWGVASPEYRRRCLVVGRRATLELRDGHDTRIFARIGAPAGADASERVIEAGGEMPLLAEIRAFLDFVRGTGAPPMSHAADGLLIVRRLSEIEAVIARRSVG
jgi:predicted dehydrogenase